MKKGVLIGIIVAAAVVIGITSAVSYSDITPSNSPNADTPISESAGTTGKHFSVKLNETLKLPRLKLVNVSIID